MKNLLFLGFLAVIALPSALAGTPRDPDVPGIPDHPDPKLDFQGAWLENAPGGVAFTVRFGGADAPAPNHSYMIAFEHDGARVVTVVAFDAQGKARSHVGPPNFNARGVPGPSDWRSPLENEEFLPGEPAHVRALIPWMALPGLSPGDVLEDLAAGTGTWTRRGWNDEDFRQVETDFVVERTIVPLIVSRNATWFVLASALVGAAAAGAAALWLRRRQTG